MKNLLAEKPVRGATARPRAGKFRSLEAVGSGLLAPRLLELPCSPSACNMSGRATGFSAHFALVDLLQSEGQIIFYFKSDNYRKLR
jgi:hypothetical protein